MLQLLREEFRRYASQFTTNDLRWSYIVLAVGLVVGAVINIFFAHGWTVWPFVAVVVMLAMVNEATDRNGQGIPPFQVYLLFFAALVIWSIFLATISQLSVPVLAAGLIATFYHAGKAWVLQRERQKLIDYRLTNSQCVFCGTPSNPEIAYCENCGEEPDPDGARLKRVASIVRNSGRSVRARNALTREKMGEGASRREQDLIQKRKAYRMKQKGM